MKSGQDGKAESKFDRAIRKFGTWIASDAHRGEVRSLDQIAADYEITRAMARDICLILRAKRMVEMRSRVGVTVAPQEEWEVFDQDVLRWRLAADFWTQLSALTDLRLTIEPHCAELAASRATSAQQGRLRTLADDLSVLGTRWIAEGDAATEAERTDYLTVDKEFHRVLLAASGTEMLRAMGPAIDLALEARNDNFAQQWLRRKQTSTGTPPQAVALLLHTGVATAIYQRRPQEAADCMIAILHEVKGKLGFDTVQRLSTVLQTLDLADENNLDILTKASAGTS